MITSYYDLEVASGGDGSSGNPYGLAEFITNGTNNSWGNGDAYTINCRGQNSLTSITFQRSGSQNYPVYLKAWNNALYGPPRMNVTGNISVLGISIEGFIMAASGTMELGHSNNVNTDPNYFLKNNVFIGDSALVWNQNNEQIIANVFSMSTSTSFQGSSGGLNSYAIDNVFDSPAVIITSYEAFSLHSENNLFVCASVTGNTFVDEGGNSFSYASAAIPAWNAVKEDWDYATILPSIPEPPNPGAGSPDYTGYEKGLFGEDRIGVGTGYFTPVAPPPVPSDPNKKIVKKSATSTGGINEQVTQMYQGDPHFAVFGGGTVVGQSKGIGQKIITEAGVSGHTGYTGPYDPNF